MEEKVEEILISEEESPPVRLDANLSQVLKPHQVVLNPMHASIDDTVHLQINGVKFIWKHILGSNKSRSEGHLRGCVLADSMGLGKTIQLISVMVTFLKSFCRSPSGPPGLVHK